MIENLIGSLMKQNKFEIFSIFLNLCYKINIRLCLLIVEKYIISLQNRLKWTWNLEIAIYQRRHDIGTQFQHINSDRNGTFHSAIRYTLFRAKVEIKRWFFF